MNIEAHLTELMRKHEKLSKMIVFEQRRPAPDTIEVNSMKKRKLILKEEINKVLDNSQ